MKTKLSWIVLFVLSGALAAAGCSSAPKANPLDPKYLKEQACKPGRDIKKVVGSLWMKIKSTKPDEPNGQFPATVVAEASGHLRLEVSNLIGSTEASIKIDDETYQVDVPSSKKQKAQSAQGSKSWGGLPLKWGTDLFLGRIPCPAPVEMDKARVSLTQDGGLTIETATDELYEFHFKNVGGASWPESLHYEQKFPVEMKVGSRGKPTVVLDFRFDDQETGTLSPRKWEAKSDQGEVKVRWRDRDVSR